MTGCFTHLRDEIVTYGGALLHMYEIEALMLKSDFGRSDPERTHEIARRAVGIPDLVTIARTPLVEWVDREEV